jgi:hypothetical protein
MPLMLMASVLFALINYESNYEEARIISIKVHAQSNNADVYALLCIRYVHCAYRWAITWQRRSELRETCQR